MEKIDTLITNALVLTMDAEGTCFENGAVAVRGDTIVAIGPVSEFEQVRAENRIDVQGKMVMPGLVNAHNHMPMTLFRGLADDLPLEQWLNEHMFPAEAQFVNSQSVRLGARLAMAEMLLSGTTTCCDGYFLAGDIAAAVTEAGMRCILGQGVIDFPAPGVPTPSDNVTVAQNFVRQWQETSPLLSPSIFCHSAYTCSPETLKAAKSAANESGVFFQIHVAETKGEADQCRKQHGCSPVQYLSRLEVLDRRTLLVHAVWVDQTDMDTIARAGANVIHCPESNMKLASGIAPVPQMTDRGIPVGLGTDGCASNNDLDLFGEMDAAAKLHKAHLADPTVMAAPQLVRMATIDGARVLAMDNLTGSLEVGKQADLITIDLAQPHLAPMYHPTSHLVYAVKGGDVRDVMIAGNWCVRDRRLLTLNLNSILDDARAMGQTIAGYIKR